MRIHSPSADDSIDTTSVERSDYFYNYVTLGMVCRMVLSVFFFSFSLLSLFVKSETNKRIHCQTVEH